MPFPQFISFPLEIQSLILESCLPNDRVCLRLTWFFSLILRVVEQELMLSSKSLYELSLFTKMSSLEKTDAGPLCGKDDCQISRWQHRMECHKASYEAVCKRNAENGRSTPEMKRKCRTRWAAHHCECYTRHTKLHRRIKSWMPSNLNYCGECEKFTKRKKQHNGRCKSIENSRSRRLLISERLPWSSKTPQVRREILDAHLSRRSFWTQNLEEVV